MLLQGKIIVIVFMLNLSLNAAKKVENSVSWSESIQNEIGTLYDDTQQVFAMLSATAPVFLPLFSLGLIAVTLPYFILFSCL